MKSKTKIKKQIKKKKNSELIEILKILNKGKNKELISLLTLPRRKRIEVNLDKIRLESRDADLIIVPGKVLSIGEINKKIKVIALSFSKDAERKLKEAKCEISLLSEEIKKNKDIKGKIIR